MVKDIFKYLIVFSFLFILSFKIHALILNNIGIKLSYSLLPIYVFHSAFSFFICTVLRVLSVNYKILQQLGFIYLISLILKIVTFSIVFNNYVFGDKDLTKNESLSMLIPIAIFLILEVYFIAKILNKKYSDRIKSKKTL